MQEAPHIPLQVSGTTDSSTKKVLQQSRDGISPLSLAGADSRSAAVGVGESPSVPVSEHMSQTSKESSPVIGLGESPQQKRTVAGRVSLSPLLEAFTEASNKSVPPAPTGNQVCLLCFFGPLTNRPLTALYQRMCCLSCKNRSKTRGGKWRSCRMRRTIS